MTFTAQELLLDVHSIEDVAYQSRAHASVDSAISKVVDLLLWHALH